MKKILILSICTLLFLTSITFAVNANIMPININKSINMNNPPNPPVINGPSSGKVRETYIYRVTVSDPDVDDLILKIEINFGDGTTSCGGCDGRGPWLSGDVVDFEHIWTRSGSFGITGRVCDEHGVWSEWSEPLPVTMPVVKTNFFQTSGLLPNLYNIN